MATHTAFEVDELLFGIYCDGSARYYRVLKDSPKTVTVQLCAFPDTLREKAYGGKRRLKKILHLCEMLQDTVLYSGATGYVVRYTGDTIGARTKIHEASSAAYSLKAGPREAKKLIELALRSSGGVYNIGDLWMNEESAGRKYYTIRYTFPKKVSLGEITFDDEGGVNKKNVLNIFVVKQNLEYGVSGTLHSRSTGTLIHHSV